MMQRLMPKEKEAQRPAVGKRNGATVVARQWELLRCLSSQWKNTAELADELSKQGERISQRTVLRDLEQLQAVFGKGVERARDGLRWRLASTADLERELRHMTVAEATAFTFLRELGSHFLPRAMISALEGYFEAARRKLSLGRKDGRPWSEKVKLVPGAMPLLPPKVDAAVQLAICDFLHQGKRFTAGYRPVNGTRQEQDFLPLGLFQQGVSVYLVARVEGKGIGVYALHRFDAVRAAEERLYDAEAEDFDLEAYLASGAAGFSSNAEPIELVVEFDARAGAHLHETPLAAGQRIEPVAGGRMRVHATVPRTVGLRWWLLSFGDAAEVIAPPSLRREIADTVSRMQARYAEPVADIRGPFHEGTSSPSLETGK